MMYVVEWHVGSKDCPHDGGETSGYSITTTMVSAFAVALKAADSKRIVVDESIVLTFKSHD